MAASCKIWLFIPFDFKKRVVPRLIGNFLTGFNIRKTADYNNREGPGC